MNHFRRTLMTLATGAVLMTLAVQASAQDALVNDIACLTGNGDCPAGDARDMVLVEATGRSTEASAARLLMPMRASVRESRS